MTPVDSAITAASHRTTGAFGLRETELVGDGLGRVAECPLLPVPEQPQKGKLTVW